MTVKNQSELQVLFKIQAHPFKIIFDNSPVAGIQVCRSNRQHVARSGVLPDAFTIRGLLELRGVVIHVNHVDDSLVFNLERLVSRLRA